MTTKGVGFWRGAGIPQGERVNTFVACGSCGGFHRTDFSGDCREDSERYADIPEGGIEAYDDEDPNPEVEVMFRVYRKGGEVIALMPYEPANHRGDVTCYVHVGQHGAADYVHVLTQTRPATEAEAAPLRRELEAAPYHYRFRVIRRRVRR